MITTEATGDSQCSASTTGCRLDIMLDALLKAAVQDPKVDAAEIYLLDDTNDELTYACHQGLSKGCVREAAATRIKPGQGIIGAVAPRGVPVFVGDLRRAAGFAREMPKREGYRSFYSVPVRLGGSVHAVWNLFSKTEGLSPRYLDWFAISAELMAVALQ